MAMSLGPSTVVERLDLTLSGRALPICLVVGASLLAYASSPFNGFVADDHAILLENPLVNGSEPLGDILTTAYLDVMYRPLTILTFAVQARVLGMNAWAYHLVNILLHALAGALVWALVRRMTSVRPVAALAAGLLFAVHTLHTDAVSAVVGRSDVLAGVFSLSSFLMFLRWNRLGGWSALAGAATLFFLGLVSKESAAPLLAFTAAFTLHAWWSRRGEGEGASPSLRGGKPAVGWALAYLVPMVVYGVIRHGILGGRLVVDKNEYFGMVDGWQTLLTMLGVGARYLQLFLFPNPLSPDYTWESIPVATSVLEPWTLAGGILVPAVVVGTGVLLVRKSERGRSAGLGMLWFLVFMAPATNLIPLMIPMAERLTYVASAGLCVAAAVGCNWLFRRWPLPALVAIALYLVLLTGMTADRDRVWRDDLTLWSDTVATHPRSAVSLANLAGALIGSGRTNAGVAALQRAVEVGPWKWGFRAVLGDVLNESGRHVDEARLLLDGLRWSHRSRVDPDRICAAVLRAAPEMGLPACLDRVRRGPAAWRGWP